MTDPCCGPLQNRNEPATVRSVYWYILEAFPRLERAPTTDEIARDFLAPRDEVISLLRELMLKGALRVEPSTFVILDAYPYSGVPTRHRVSLGNGMSVYCMCAIDAFYVPFLTGYDLTIHSRCFHCRSEIEISIDRYEISRAEPSSSVVWNSSAPYDCPQTNFFCSEEHLLQWREKNSDEPGQLFSLAEALDAGEKEVDRIKQSKHELNEILWAKSDELVCYCREVPKATVVATIKNGSVTVEKIAKETTACTGRWCKDTNPRKRCCCNEIEALIAFYSKKRENKNGDERKVKICEYH